MVDPMRLSVSPKPFCIMSSDLFWSRTSSPMAIVIWGEYPRAECKQTQA
jgi:hypothetical protein